MTKSCGSLLFLFFLLLLSFNFGGHLKFANGGGQLQIPSPTQIGENRSWCVAKPTASDEELKSDIEYACNVLSDCTLIQPGGSCAYPDTLMNHASVVMNQYYALKGRNTWDCYFSNSALIAVTDPSYNGCWYA